MENVCEQIIELQTSRPRAKVQANTFHFEKKDRREKKKLKIEKRKDVLCSLDSMHIQPNDIFMTWFRKCIQWFACTLFAWRWSHWIHIPPTSTFSLCRSHVYCHCVSVSPTLFQTKWKPSASSTQPEWINTPKISENNYYSAGL